MKVVDDILNCFETELKHVIKLNYNFATITFISSSMKVDIDVKKESLKGIEHIEYISITKDNFRSLIEKSLLNRSSVAYIINTFEKEYIDDTPCKNIYSYIQDDHGCIRRLSKEDNLKCHSNTLIGDKIGPELRTNYC